MQIRLLGNSLVLCLTFLVVTTNAQHTTPAQTSPCAKEDESGLPLPSSFLPAKLSEFQAQLKTFLTSGKYRTLKWCEDKKFRDTGPFVNGVSYGVHPTVKIYYSPAVIDWLLRKDPTRVIPDGAMIVKEQYSPPAARYQLQPPKGINGWTIMIKDSKGAQDGWYWAEIWDAQCVDNNNPPFAYPYAGFGLYCVRCHASAEKSTRLLTQTTSRAFLAIPILTMSISRGRRRPSRRIPQLQHNRVVKRLTAIVMWPPPAIILMRPMCKNRHSFERWLR